MGPFRPDLLKGKTVLVTGGATGLGRAMAEGFAAHGASIALAGRREEKLQEAAEAFREAGHDVFVQSCDVREPSSLSALADALDERFGGVDVLVNNAAGNFISPTERLSPRAVDAVLNIVLHGTFYATLEFGKRWIAAGRGGTMLNIVTTYAETGSGFVAPSAAAKAGVLALTRSLAVEWARYGIRQVAIAPGPFPTEGAWARLAPTPELAARMADRIPLKRVGDKQELADLAAFLVSDYASYLNGEVVTIDGGEWLQGAGQFNSLLEVTADQWDRLAELTRKGGKGQ
ncbi:MULTISPECIES: SDR family oxidoreductase [unclassified Paenibacillus]|uniref:SDR family oxidoreductase n=1 Tax=unclassified Paenibacillus TaxID=185978 RepID=UPI000955126C|nr:MULTISPECIES: SDR family oxidoreductase [unclassified Paenibacillus]ASS65539.1 SDR family oxidoreductase [Paenibacillus sp. RUD330]SIQ32713.1 NAD(P)-dependent dehydrogenase, short-chain alcohol dehydrogenase family [Paenibacillus sp. RU4X]SIQ54307.1 NAD(P)-dependent dehydrogenase, short-chain alcohol dehydrogenase family [Paenibacillus sp. RU4T]